MITPISMTFCVKHLFLFVSAWFVNGKYLIIIVSVAIILPLGFMKRLGTFLPTFPSFIHFQFSRSVILFYFIITIISIKHLQTCTKGLC